MLVILRPSREVPLRASAKLTLFLLVDAMRDADADRDLERCCLDRDGVLERERLPLDGVRERDLVLVLRVEGPAC